MFHEVKEGRRKRGWRQHDFKQAQKHAGKNAGCKTFPQHVEKKKKKLHPRHTSSLDVDGDNPSPLCCGDYADYDSVIN